MILILIKKIDVTLTLILMTRTKDPMTKGNAYLLRLTNLVTSARLLVKATLVYIYQPGITGLN